ncbi:MAG TPA: pyruvate dehydrogenase (acetyl-transferring) E1 component subunit alpha [Phycisphaerales bacterium]|nr:pyruvate dehydrogenase (acetyl-transferring) E1 component subunit alpha [Phycisphaerales bacterium]
MANVTARPMNPAMTDGRGPKAEQSPRPSDSLPASTFMKWLRDMYLIREFENRTAQAYQQAKIGGFCHLYIGQEALVVGTINSVNQDDPIVTAYRDHGHALARGMSPEACMAEMYGKIGGCAKGKGGSMHMFDRPNWLFGGHGIVSAQNPLGTGLAFAAKYEVEVLGKALPNPGVEPGQPAKKKVALCYMGDGALNQGALHEAMNHAGLWSLPIIFIVENNGYSMGTAIGRGTTMADNLTKKADAYGIRGEIIDGFDVVDLYDEFKPLADWCRENQKPAFVDLKTYRYLGHSMSDPQKYRTKEEVEQFKAKDSIDRLAAQLMNERKGPDGKPMMTEQQFMDMQSEVKEAVKRSLDFAEQSPIPDASELYTDVLLNPMKNMSPSAEYTRGTPNPLFDLRENLD